MGATMTDRSRAPLELFKAPTPLKLAALWASLMFCYVYGDYLGLYVPGKLTEVAAGRMSFGALTPGKLTLVAIMMAVPGLMIARSLLLSPELSRATMEGQVQRFAGRSTIVRPAQWQATRSSWDRR